MRVLLGLTGRKEVGKDTCYNRLRELFSASYIVERVGFADLIYRSAAEALSVSVADLHRWKGDPQVKIVVVQESLEGRAVQTLHELNVRQFLQRYGYEAHRNIFGLDFWEKQVDLEQEESGILVVTDVRLPSEAQLIKAQGGKIIKVLGKDEDQWDFHATEQTLPKELIDHTIDNSARGDTFASLDDQLVRLMIPLLYVGGGQVL